MTFTTTLSELPLVPARFRGVAVTLYTPSGTYDPASFLPSQSALPLPPGAHADSVLTTSPDAPVTARSTNASLSTVKDRPRMSVIPSPFGVKIGVSGVANAGVEPGCA